MLSRRELMEQLSKRLDYLNYSGLRATTIPKEELEAILCHLDTPSEETTQPQDWGQFAFFSDKQETTGC